MIGLFLDLASVILAQETQTLALEEAVRLGTANSKALHASLMDVDAAVARYDASRAARMPSVNLAGGYTYLSTVPEFSLQTPPPDSRTIVVNPSIHDAYLLRLSALQPLYTGNRLEGLEKMAAFQALAGRQDLAQDTHQLAFQIKAAYWDLHRAREVLRVVEENAVRMEAHLQDVRNLLSEGMATANDVLKIGTQLSSVRLMRIDAQNGADLSRMTLNNTLGLPLDTALELATPLPESRGAPEDAESEFLGALENRPESRALALRRKAAQAAVEVAGAGAWPQVFLTGGYTYARPNSRIFPGEDRFNGTWDVGVGVSVTLWDGNSTRLQIRQARAQAERAEDTLGAVKDAIRLEVRAALLKLRGAVDKVEESGAGVRQAEENLRVTKERFQEGVVISSEVLDAEVALLQAELQRTQSRVEAALARDALDLAVGRE